MLVQAALAERATLVPDLEPFRAVATEWKTGATFECEDVASLGAKLRSFVRSPWSQDPLVHRRYVERIESWDVLARIVSR